MLNTRLVHRAIQLCEAMKDNHPTLYFHCLSEEDNKVVMKALEKYEKGIDYQFESEYPTGWHIKGVVFFDYKKGEGI